MAPRLRHAASRFLAHERHRLEACGGRLETYGQALSDTLARGFALIRDAAGTIVDSAAALASGDALTIEFHDGKLAATVDGARRAAPKPKKPAPDQGSLL